MSTSIGGIGGYSQMMAMQGMRGGMRPPPDAEKMAEDLFAKLDAKGQGYIEKSDLVSAMSATDGGDAEAEDIFNALDGDADGKLTQTELADAIKKLEEELRGQFDRGRMGAGAGGPGGMAGMPPPPSPGDDQGFSKEELEAQLSEIGETDSRRANLIANILDNFEQADSDGDGKVGRAEAMAFDQESRSAVATSTDSEATVASTRETSARVMAQLQRLMESYGLIDHGARGGALSEVA